MKNTASKSKVIFAVLDFAKPILVVLIVFALMTGMGFRVARVEGASMNSTLESGELIAVSNFFYTPKTGDIIVISKGEPLNRKIVKRVIATEGQSLKLDYDNDKIYVDGKELDEPYIDGSTFNGNQGNYEIPSVIPAGKLFVMGDNRGVSLDSRNTSVGLIDKEEIIGKAQFAFFPFDRLGGFDN